MKFGLMFLTAAYLFVDEDISPNFFIIFAR
jgi:hypothetical protein